MRYKSSWLTNEIRNFWDFIEVLFNKTPGYLRDILRPPTLLKMPFRRMKAFFFSKYFLFIINPNFSNFIFVLIFSQKTSKIRWNDFLEEIIPFETHSRKKMPPLAILKNLKVFSSEKTIHFSIFLKKTKVWTFWEVLLSRSHSTANLLQFGEKSSRSERVNIVLARAQLANIGLKNGPIWEEDFAFIFLRLWRKIITRAASKNLKQTTYDVFVGVRRTVWKLRNNSESENSWFTAPLNLQKLSIHSVKL